MTRYALILLALAIVIPASAPVAAKRKKRPPKLEVTLSITKRKAELLDEIPMTVTVKNKGGKEVMMPPLRISDHAVTIVLKDGDKTFRLRRIYGTFSGGKLFPADVVRSKLRRSRKVTEKLEMIAIRPGTYEVTAEVRGVEGLEEPAVSRAIKLQVMPPDEGKSLRATIRTNKGDMTAELYPDDAYNHCHEFVLNARARFYNGLVFFRIVKGFMGQTGCPKNIGNGNAGYNIPQEFNERKHVRGVLSAARSKHEDSAGSQFFVMHQANASLDGRYTVFGKVIENVEVMDKITSVRVKAKPNGEKSEPLERVEINGIDIRVK